MKKHPDNKDPWNWTHTDSDGKFHRVVRADRGHESFDRYVVHVDGIMVYYGPDMEAANYIWDQYKNILEMT